MIIIVDLSFIKMTVKPIAFHLSIEMDVVELSIVNKKSRLILVPMRPNHKTFLSLS